MNFYLHKYYDISVIVPTETPSSVHPYPKPRTQCLEFDLTSMIYMSSLHFTRVFDSFGTVQTQ